MLKMSRDGIVIASTIWAARGMLEGRVRVVREAKLVDSDIFWFRERGLGAFLSEDITRERKI